MLITPLDWRNCAIVIAESPARVSNPWRSLAVTSPLNAQKSVLIDPAFLVLRSASLGWRSFVQPSFHLERWNGLRELNRVRWTPAAQQWVICWSCPSKIATPPGSSVNLWGGGGNSTIPWGSYHPKAFVSWVSDKSENCSKRLQQYYFIIYNIFRKLATIFGELVTMSAM